MDGKNPIILHNLIPQFEAFFVELREVTIEHNVGIGDFDHFYEDRNSCISTNHTKMQNDCIWL